MKRRVCTGLLRWQQKKQQQSQTWPSRKANSPEAGRRWTKIYHWMNEPSRIVLLASLLTRRRENPWSTVNWSRDQKPGKHGSNPLPMKAAALEEMGHPQPKTTVATDNSTAEGLVNKTMTPNRAKTYDFRTNWVKCREAQNQFNVMWKKGGTTEQITTLRTTLLMCTKKKEVNIYMHQSPNWVHSSLARVC